MPHKSDSVIASDKHKKPPRISSTYNWATYAQIVNISQQIDFNDPMFNGKYKRNNSWASGQAFLVELLLGIPNIDVFLKAFMVNEGKNYLPVKDYGRIHYEAPGYELKFVDESIAKIEYNGGKKRT